MIEIELLINDCNIEGELIIRSSEDPEKEIYTEDIILEPTIKKLLSYKKTFKENKVIFYDTNYGKIYIKKEFNFISFFQVNFGDKNSTLKLYKEKGITKEHLDYIIEGNQRYENNEYIFSDLYFQCNMDEWEDSIRKFKYKYKDLLEKLKIN